MDSMASAASIIRTAALNSPVRARVRPMSTTFPMTARLNIKVSLKVKWRIMMA